MSLDKAFYNYLLNPVMRRLLKSPLHRLASGNIAVLHFRGRKSGRDLNTPLSYARDGDLVRLLSSQNTRWWKNFRGSPQPVEIDIAGERHQGKAILYEGDSEALRRGVARFIAAVPRDALVYGLKLDRQKRPTERSLAANAHRLILVEVTLTTP